VRIKINMGDESMGRIQAKDGKKNLSGQHIHALREKAGLSQEALAAQLQSMGLHIDRSVIKRIEKGERKVRDFELRAFARYFHVTCDYLLDGIEKDPPA